MEDEARRVTGNDLHASHMSRSINELQRMVNEHEEALAKLRAQPLPQTSSGNKDVARASLEVMKTAYDEVSESQPFLPFPDSVLPSLLAMRKTHQTIVESQTYLSSQTVSLDRCKQQLELEQNRLEDQKLLSTSLERRIETLRNGLESRMEMTPEQITRERLDELRQRKTKYDRQTAQLLKSLKRFIDDKLAPMLAAEELGGPVVGDMMEIEAENLEAGFSSQGRPKKAGVAPDQDKRQRRIDQIWGPGQDQEGPKGHDRDEAAAAGVEMRKLTEQLLNRLTESGGDSSAAYTQIARESAAARFLVRSKVAQFHPKDATRLRLVDFGRELDD